MLRRFPLILASALSLAGSLVAQEGSPAEPALCPCPPPPPPPPIWTGGIAAGLSITSGNSDNESANLAVTAQRDAGVGYIREEFTGGRTDSSATYRVGESLAWKLSPSQPSRFAGAREKRPVDDRGGRVFVLT